MALGGFSQAPPVKFLFFFFFFFFFLGLVVGIFVILKPVSKKQTSQLGRLREPGLTWRLPLLHIHHVHRLASYCSDAAPLF